MGHENRRGSGADSGSLHRTVREAPRRKGRQTAEGTRGVAADRLTRGSGGDEEDGGKGTEENDMLSGRPNSGGNPGERQRERAYDGRVESKGKGRPVHGSLVGLPFGAAGTGGRRGAAAPSGGGTVGLLIVAVLGVRRKIPGFHGGRRRRPRLRPQAGHRPRQVEQAVEGPAHLAREPRAARPVQTREPDERR